jgi:tRNA U34 5-methylaminomethyl-2-thiouridine-forming methyltransferase MnmC
MANYTITLTEAENKALSYVALAQQEWINNAVHERCRVAIDEIVQLAVTNFLAVGEPIPNSRDAIVERAFELGLVKTAAQRQAEAEAEAAARLGQDETNTNV